jgi:hypothetical protein
MPRKSRRRTKTRKQKIINMVGCSNKCSNRKHHKSCKNVFLSHHGGQGCGSTGCPISPLSFSKMNAFSDNYKPPVFQSGGCDNCIRGGTSMKDGTSMKGGNSFYKPAPPMPGPLVGSAWAYNKLPGMDGIGGNRNYLSPVNVGKDPALQMTMNGSGYKTMNSMVGGIRRGRRQKTVKNMQSGGLIPQDLVNLGRNFSFNLSSAYNALNGQSAPTDPLPYRDQLTNTVSINRI